MTTTNGAITGARTARPTPSRRMDARVPHMSRAARFRYFLRWAGAEWTGLYLVRQGLSRVLFRLNRRMMRLEEQRFLTGDLTVSASFNTADRNAAMWNSYDWSQMGEEWSEHALGYKGFEPREWKQRVIAELIDKHIPTDGVVLEVGPGGGRWTEHLLDRNNRVVLVDVAERCLALCRSRFNSDPRLSYCLVREGESDFIGSDRVPDRSIDAIWSYDAFVHINPTDTERYIREFQRIMRPGAVAVIHHVGRSPSEGEYKQQFRAQMNARFFAHLLAENQLQLVEQSEELAHREGDVITVFTRVR
jgi:ubiquinone/menaquinone biosynthesis C-methylase UbiE